MRRALKIALWLGVLLGLGGCEQPVQSDPNWPLKQVFTKDAAVLKMNGQAVAEVCPDNGCFRFVMQDEKSLDVVHDFTYLYLWVVETLDLEARRDAKGQRFIPAILNKRKGNCTGEDEYAIARCTLALMWKSHKIVGLEKKFEDGWNRTLPLDIAARLKQVGVIQ